ncbi:efflux transporter outer membrane subunit [Shewanella sp. MEBiC00475]|uniref:efflux transporter outer membrane subunit n=1 Tax=Shewanella sp. MEBiC00475 TaxID=2575361 RepID=UPI0020C79019|nr:efflux transporter outer membrane subunit [Shewanella sp. MEBiC00475]
MRTEFTPPEVDIPTSWQSVSLNQQVNLDPWWQSFNNPELNQLIEQVLITNNDLALATLTLRTARLQAGLTDTQRYPQISANLNGSKSKPLEGGASATEYGSNVSLSYELDLWGRVSADMDAAKWTSLATAEDRESTAQSLVATTATLYWQIGYLKQSIALSQNSVDYAQQILDLTERQYRSGAVSQLNVFEAKSNLAGQQASHSDLQQQLTEAQNSLAILYNQPPSKMPIHIDKLPGDAIPTIAEGIPADLLIRRPDVKSALYALKSAYASKDATFAGYLPTLTLSGSLGTASNELKDLLQNPIGTLGANLVLPFVQWNEMQLYKQMASVEVESAVVTYRKTLYNAFKEVDNAISARQHYQYQEQKLREQYDAASAAEHIYASQYRNGAVSIQDWLDAKETQRSAEVLLLANRYNQFSAQATLYQALGGSDIAAPLVTE